MKAYLSRLYLPLLCIAVVAVMYLFKAGSLSAAPASLSHLKNLFGDHLPLAHKKAKKEEVTLVLLNGTTIVGEVLSAQGDSIVIKWRGGYVTFLKKELARVQWSRGVAAAAQDAS